MIRARGALGFMGLYRLFPGTAGFLPRTLFRTRRAAISLAPAQAKRRQLRFLLWRRFFRRCNGCGCFDCRSLRRRRYSLRLFFRLFRLILCQPFFDLLFGGIVDFLVIHRFQNGIKIGDGTAKPFGHFVL